MSGQSGTPGKDQLQTQGRKDNAAQPLDASDNTKGAERYPPEGKDDAVERSDPSQEPRSFGGKPANPAPRQGAGDGGPAPSVSQGRLGPGADPAEGKR